MNTLELQALWNVLYYIEDDEAEDFYNNKHWHLQPGQGHIYLDIIRLRSYYDEQKKQDTYCEDWHSQADGSRESTEDDDLTHSGPRQEDCLACRAIDSKRQDKSGGGTQEDS